MGKSLDISFNSIWSVIKILFLILTIAGGIAVLIWIWNKIKGLPGNIINVVSNLGRQGIINEAVAGGVDPDRVQAIFDTLDGDLIRASVWKSNWLTQWYGQMLEDNAYAKAKASLSQLKASLGQ